MRKVIFALLLVAILLSLFASVAFATVPDYEDPVPPGAGHAPPGAGVQNVCIPALPSVAVHNAGFGNCP